MGWLDDFSTTGGYDAVGGYSRAWINLSELLYGPGPKTGQFRRCPGANEAPAADGSNVLSAAEAAALRVRPEPEVGGPVRRAGAIAAVVAACVAAALGLGAKGEDSDAKTYEIVLDNAFGLADGGDFKVAGVKAGKTGDVHLEGQAHPLAVVDAKVTEPGLADLREDARCEVRPQSFIGEYFIDCQPGTSPHRLPDGGRVPVSQTSSTIGLDLVNNILRRPFRDRLRLIVGELGAGLAGRPDDLNDVIRRAAPGLRETSKTLRVLGRQTKQIDSLIVDADRVIGALEARKGDVSRFVREAGQTAATTATRREELAASFRELPAFLAELEPYMGRLGDLAQAQRPVLRDLDAASGDLEHDPGPAAAVRAGRHARVRVTRRRVCLRAPRRARELRGDPGAAPGRRRTHPSSRSRCASSSRRSTSATARSSPTRAPPPPTRRPRTRPTSRAAAASPAWRRSGTTSTGRRSAPTRSTTSATCCAWGSTRRAASPTPTTRTRARRRATSSWARRSPGY